MNQHDLDLAELLRRVLHAEADSIEPAEDGLERIRARLTEPHSTPRRLDHGRVFRVAGRVRGRTADRSGVAAARCPAPSARTVPPAGPAARPAARGVASVAVLAPGRLHRGGATVFALTPLPQQAVAQAVALIRSFEGGGPAVGGRRRRAVSGQRHAAGRRPAPGAAHGKRGHKQRGARPLPDVRFGQPERLPRSSACPSATASAEPTA